MGLVIDTNVFIEIEKGTKNIDFTSFEKYGDIYISAITVSELLVGVYSANSKAREIKRRAFVEKILEKMAVLPFTAEVARIHAELSAKLTKSGKMVGAHDLIIAATALSLGHTVLTRDLKAFQRIPGLEVISG